MNDWLYSLHDLITNPVFMLSFAVFWLSTGTLLIRTAFRKINISEICILFLLLMLIRLIYHRVNTYIEDDDFDMVSQEILLNGSFDKWSNRVHSAYENNPPARIQPKMESLLNKPGENSHDMWEEFEWGDFLLSREESLLLHTIQSERLKTDFSLFKKQPSIESALVI